MSIEFMKQLQKHNAELVMENSRLKDEREQILRILDSDNSESIKSKINSSHHDSVCKVKTLAEVLEEKPGFSSITNGNYGTFKSVEIKEPADVSMSMKFNLLAALYLKTRMENTFSKEEIRLIEVLSKRAIRDVSDEHFNDLLKIAKKLNMVVIL